MFEVVNVSNVIQGLRDRTMLITMKLIQNRIVQNRIK